MNVITLALGPLATNCYLVHPEAVSAAIIVDAAGDADDIVQHARRRGLAIVLIALTHAHIDHIQAAAQLKQLTGAQLAVHQADAPMLGNALLSGAAVFGFDHAAVSADRLLEEGDTVSLEESGLELTVLHTPGHTPGSICLLGEGVLFSGDCLFAGGIGRTDLPGGDDQAMLSSLHRLTALDGSLTVYPGHGPTTTIAEEREANPFLHGW